MAFYILALGVDVDPNMHFERNDLLLKCIIIDFFHRRVIPSYYKCLITTAFL